MNTHNIYHRPVLFALFSCGLIFGRLPPDVPGEQISDKDYWAGLVNTDSIDANPPATSPLAASWFDIAQQTWEAPPAARQIAADNTNIPMGKGALFVPCLTSGNLEPEIEVLDSTGQVVATRRTGKLVPLLPGSYFVMLGSGAHQSRMVRNVRIGTGAVTPVIADWSALSIDVVDENSLSFTGEYEIAQMGDLYEPIGRGVGIDPTLGEEIKTWILQPGTYKIFGVGQSYNTQKNFVTVRLLPGELVRFVLIESKVDQLISGGGVLDPTLKRSVTGPWTITLDLGGNLLFNALTDRRTDSTTISTAVALLMAGRLNYRKDPFEIDNRLRFDESVSLNRFDLTRVVAPTDEVRLTTLFVWRFLSWLGPYSRLEASSHIFPVNKYFDENVSTHFMIKLNTDSTVASFDSITTSTMIKPSFSPFFIDAGIGANADVFNMRFFEAKVKAGFGLSYNAYFGQSRIVDSTFLGQPKTSLDSLTRSAITRGATIFSQTIEDVTSLSFGPEIGLTVLVRMGRVATVEGDLRILAPLSRIDRVDLSLSLLSAWHISRNVNLDYQYELDIAQPKEVEAQRSDSKHLLRLRFSITGRQ